MSLLRNCPAMWRTARWLGIALAGIVGACSMNPRPEEEPDSILLADDGEREQPATGAAGAAGIEDTGDEGLTNDGNANEAPNDQQEDPDSIIDPAQEGPSDPENLGDAGPPEPELRDAGAFSSESLDGGGFD